MRVFEDYSIEDNVKFINELLESMPMKDIEEQYYNVGERVIVKRLARKGYKRSSEGKRPFILANSNKSIKEDIDQFKNEVVDIFEKYDDKISQNKAISESAKNKSEEVVNPDQQLSNEEIKQLRGLLKVKDDILYMLNSDSKCNTNNIQHINNIDNTHIIQVTKSKQKMFRVDEVILKEWNVFCEENKHIKVQSLISSALKLFMDSYNKQEK